LLSYHLLRSNQPILSTSALFLRTAEFLGHWNRDRKATSNAHLIDEINPPTTALNDMPQNRQAQTSPLIILLSCKETFKDLIDMLGCDPTTAIRDCNYPHRLACRETYSNTRWRSFWRRLYAVVDEAVQDLF
jgi:hypothetical protein